VTLQNLSECPTSLVENVKDFHNPAAGCQGVSAAKRARNEGHRPLEMATIPPNARSVSGDGVNVSRSNSDEVFVSWTRRVGNSGRQQADRLETLAAILAGMPSSRIAPSFRMYARSQIPRVSRTL
jgi:hypothetical protein